MFSTQTTHNCTGSSIPENSQRRLKCYIVPDAITQRLVGESLMLAVAQLIQVGDAGEVDHRRWTAHQHLTIGSNKMAKECPKYFETAIINKCVLATL